jgi:ABC-type nitrate/sulfonate/bicarbonate transport system substrate-binding protein
VRADVALVGDLREVLQRLNPVVDRKGHPDWVARIDALKGDSAVRDIKNLPDHGKLYADAYSVSPAAVFVPPESPIREPQQLAGVPISVGHQSGSHYSTIQALEQYMKPDEINLSFADGILFGRLEKLIDRQVPAAALFSGPYYFLEQLGFRKIIDTTFMMASMITGSPDQEDVRKYFRALRNAQRDIDLRPELYTHYYRKEFPQRFLDQVDTRRWGPGERIVFEPYTRETFEDSFKWVQERKIFDPAQMGSGRYDEAVVSASSWKVALPQ